MSLESREDAWAWWGARRLRYNLALILAGGVAFALYFVALAVRCADVPGVEVTLVSMLFQGVGYLVAMGVANLCYNLDPVLESRLGSRDVAAYRRVAFKAGLWLSVMLPFVIPALIFLFGCRPETS
jgi:hypothetical protein